jgi:hypothetical protein
MIEWSSSNDDDRYGHYNQNPPCVALSAAVDPDDLRRLTVPLLGLRLSSGLVRVMCHPDGRFDIHVAIHCPASTITWRCFPGVRRERVVFSQCVHELVPYISNSSMN